MQDNRVNLDFADADIQDVVKQISEITGRNFILDERVRGKITIISPSPVTVDEAYKVFESVLNVKGFTTIPAGKFLKIVPLREAKESNISTFPGGTRVPDRDNYVTRLIPLRYVDATDISNSLKPLVSRDASMIPYAPTNTIILSDSAYNINKILEIVEEIDVSSYQETLEIIVLKYASAKEIADEMSQVFGEQQQGGGGGGVVRRIRQAGGGQPGGQAGPKIITDERTNSLIVLASPRQIEDIRNLIRRLDYETGRGRIHVYYLENADAKELAETLAGLGVGEAGAAGARTGAAGAAQGQPGGVPAAVAATVAELGEGVKITHDEPTNALIIESSPEAYETIKEVIEKLDIKRPQVLVEALLLEVSVGPNTLSTGVSVAGGNVFDQNDLSKGAIVGNTSNSVFPGGGSGLISPGDLKTLIESGASGPLFGSLIQGFKAVNVRTAGPDGQLNTADDVFVPFPVIRFAIQAAASRTDTNILSAPNILTTDNQEAEIQVGENIPIQTAAVSSTTSGTTDTTTDDTLVNNSFERQDTGVILKVTPQISEGDNVRLEISNEITEVKDDGSPVGLPNLTKRSVKNVVYVADGGTVVIGGIISSKLTKGSNRVPWLGDIPGLGWAFKANSKSLTKINLIVFLTPHIVRSPEDLRRVTNFKQKEFETKSREALRKPEDEERRDREVEEKARLEGKTVEEYEDKYNLKRAKNPIDLALRDVKRRNLRAGEEPSSAAPKATPGRREEIIGGPESKARDKDVTGKVIVEGRDAQTASAGPAPAKEEAPPEDAPESEAEDKFDEKTTPSGHYTVQVAALADRGKAERLTDALKEKRYDVYVTSAVVQGGGVVHRVRVGRFETDDEARKVAERLGKEFSSEEAVPFVVKLSE
jgi:general secretion pathway protein D